MRMASRPLSVIFVTSPELVDIDTQEPQEWLGWNDQAGTESEGWPFSRPDHPVSESAPDAADLEALLGAQCCRQCQHVFKAKATDVESSHRRISRLWTASRVTVAFMLTCWDTTTDSPRPICGGTTFLIGSEPVGADDPEPTFRTGKSYFTREPWVPGTVQIPVSKELGGWTVTAWFAATSRGPYCVSLTVEPTELQEMESSATLPPDGISQKLLRGILINELKADLLAKWGNRFADFANAANPVPTGKGRPPDTDVYRKVALDYLEACEQDPKRPVLRLAQNLKREEQIDTIRKQVAKARELGYLAPAIRGGSNCARGPKLLKELQAQPPVP